ncbi:hypothetical protein J7K93_14025 [bacterium]|nr:hypothetical protein [bacterium]
MKRILLYSLMLLFLILNFNQLGAVQEHSNSKKAIVLICLEKTTLLCPLCLDQFLDICKKIEKYKSKFTIIGVYLIDNNEKITSTDVKIEQLKLMGFVKANNLSFPFYIDKNHIFGEDGCIIIISENYFRRLTLQLNPLQIKEFEETLQKL